MTEDGYERMERKSLLAGTPQEVIITICKGELRAGGLRVVGIPSVCFGTRMKHYITQPDYMWRARMHKCREMNTHTQTQTFSGPQAAAENFLKRGEQLDAVI